MGSQYAGSATYPTDFTIPDDGDAKDATSINVALEALGDRTAWLKANLAYLESTPVTATGSVVVPSGATHCLYEGCGGGGGGGGGAGSAGSGRVENGGAGGAGAVRRFGLFAVTAGETLTVEVGAGGAGGAGVGVQGSALSPQPGSNGSSGTDSTIKRGATTIVTARGGGSGTGAAGLNQQSTMTPINPDLVTQYIHLYSSGGLPVKGTVNIKGPVYDAALVHSRAPQEGGPGLDKRATSTLGITTTGRAAPEGNLGGSGGLAGADSATYIGGGPGGGGGGGPYGPGGAGGNGGAANNAGAGSNGADGTSAADNTGAGGGGAGSAGGCNTGSGTGGTGGAGGSGRWTLTFLRTV